MKNTTLFILLGFALFLGSCISQKEATYMQGFENETEIAVSEYETMFQVGDLLSVNVSTIDPELSEPFNQIEMLRQSSNQMTSYENGVPASIGYLIESDSTITLPIVGKVKIAGYERTRAVDTIQNKLSEYIDNPTVTAQILNYKVTVLGDVKKPGTFTIPNGRITVLEAIGIANDLNMTGKRTNVLVVRNEGGVVKEYRLDLTDQNFFSSPAYYLRQNDVVYIEANGAARYKGSVLNAAGGTVLAATSLIISTLVLIFN